MTLSKIDAIEAQMSDQWRQGEATRPAAAQSSAQGEAFAKLPESPDYQATQPDWLAADRAHADSLGFLPTALMASLELRSAVGKAQSLPPAERPAGDAAGFSVHWDDVISSPELEEAAIRFANGDSSGAEAGLLDAIRRAQARPDQIRNWAWALFDLYRATGRKSGFDHLADECLRRFGWPPPNWAPIPPAADHAAAEAIDPLAQSVPSAERVWRSPAHFDVASLGELRRTLANAPQPWKLDWSAMHSLDPAAVQGLATQFGDWCETAAQRCFAAADRLQHVLRVYTTAAGGSAGTAAWQLRMDALRLRLEVPEREAARLQVGQVIRFRAEGLTNTFVATLQRLSPAIREDNRMLAAEADVKNPGTLRPGQFTRTEIVIAAAESVLCVPRGAIVTFAGIEKVFILKDGRLIERAIRTGRVAGGWTEVLEGLKAGDEIAGEAAGVADAQVAAGH